MLNQADNVAVIAGLSEPELIQRAQERDEPTLSYIYEAHHDRVYRYILARTGKPEDAEDLTTDVFIKMLDGLAGFQWRGVTLSAWLFRVAHNMTVDFLRRRNRRPEHVALPFNLWDEGCDTPAEVEKPLTLQEVAAAVGRLSPAQQEVIHLRFAAGFTVLETAQTLGKNQGAVKVLQYNAIMALRRMFRGQAQTADPPAGTTQRRNVPNSGCG
ncbi:MAG: sigma-70 family RNA polymerase sigma factor [Chloroflexi bacterium]|nr:sigma-70 family RNA polymerase sigma factor [Chloroflexota bacterium]